jgi:hypothetical protein
MINSIRYFEEEYIGKFEKSEDEHRIFTKLDL